MRHLLSILCTGAILAVCMGGTPEGRSSQPAVKALPAFPGAEGFGAVSVGGRGGKVIHVTSLADTGPGSLRAALAEKGPRIIVFDVGGTIEPKTELWMPNGNGAVTIAGQTAPGGITIVGGTFGVPGYGKGVTTDVIVRHIRVRGVYNTAEPGQGGDAINVYDARRVILDHCSFAGSMDETIDSIHSAEFTTQWCMIEEPALWGQGGNQHDEGDHNLAFISSYPPSGSVTVHHTLLAHASGRNPMITAGPADVRNNVMYDFQIGFDAGDAVPASDGKPQLYAVVGNYFRKGAKVHKSIDAYYGFGKGRFFMSGNLLDVGDGAVSEFDDPWTQIGKGQKLPDYVVYWGGGTRQTQAPPVPPVTTQSAQEAYKLVLATAGAWPRDATTRRVIRDVETRTGDWGLGGPYEHFAARTDGPTSAANDTDRDGIPDAWEKAHGLNPTDPADGSRIVPVGASPNDRHAGYTYAEYYLNELADSIVGVPTETATVRVAVDGRGHVVCDHSGRTPKWATDPAKVNPAWGHKGGPLEVDWGRENVFTRGSTVVLRALPQESLGVGAPVVSTFDHWSGGAVDGVKTPTVTITVDKDVTVTAHFAAK